MICKSLCNVAYCSKLPFAPSPRYLALERCVSYFVADDNDKEEGIYEMVEFEFEAGANNSAEFNSTSNNVPNNAMIHQAVNGISSQPSYLEAVLGGRNSGMDEALGEHHYLNNDKLLSS